MISTNEFGKIEKACGGALKPALADPWLKITETATGRGKTRKVERAGMLLASDSYVAIRIPVSVEDDETTGSVPLTAITFARTFGKRGASIKCVEDRAIVLSGGHERGSFPREQQDYPDVGKLFIELKIGLNPKLLVSIAEALGAERGLQIEISDPLKPALVTTLGGQGQALIMPIRIAGAR